MPKLPPYILTNPNSGRHLYRRGWLGLIPLIGLCVGIGLLLLGIVRYKDKKLIWIGIAAIFFTVAVYGSIILYSNSDNARKQWASAEPGLLNNIVKDIEFYKLQRGQYPYNLNQLRQYDPYILLTDPLSARALSEKKEYNYEKIDNRYTLFSSGIDKIPRTADDIFPSVDTSNIGLIISRR